MSLNTISQNDEDGLALARQIPLNGWRQGTVFDPRGVLNKITIAETEISLSDDEFLIICTQSCTLVSRRFEADPYAEAMIVKLIDDYNPRSQEATGKNQRKLQIKLSDHPKYKCIECDINKRFMFNRKRLLEIQPSKNLSWKKMQGISLQVGMDAQSHELPSQIYWWKGWGTFLK